MLDATFAAAHPAEPVVPESRNVPEMFLRRVERTPNARAYLRKRAGVWASATWRDVHALATAAATWLMEQGLGAGDKLTIVGSTRPEWAIADIAGLLAGAVTVGAYPTLTADQLAYILDHSDTRIAFVEDRAQLEKILSKKRELTKIERIVVWDTAGCERELAAHGLVVAWDELLRSEPNLMRIKERIAGIDAQQTAIIVYTSGTTGPPKGAMISHENILVMLSAAPLMDPEQDDVSLVFLPMAHVAERVLSFYGRINFGTAAAYASSVPAVLEEVHEVKPNTFGSVPRIFEKAYARIQAEVAKAPPARQKVFRWAESTGRKVVERWQKNERIPRPLLAQYRIADRLVFARLREVFGGRVRYFVTGAAPIPRAILEFFWSAGFPIYEVYGMTEATVLTHSNRPGAVRIGSVGRPFEFVEDRIAGDGEILVRGKTVFQGYYKDPSATAEAIDADGWLHTGDIGKKDADGFLYIVDRKKHIIITAGGKNLTPANIENEIKTQDPMISQVHAHGDRRAYVTALVTLSALDAIEWAKEKGLLENAAMAESMRRALLENPLARPAGLDDILREVSAQPELRTRIADAVRRGNARLSRVEQVKRFVLLDRDFSLDEDEVTPTLKLKRKNVEKKFAETFDRLYGDDAFGISV